MRRIQIKSPQALREGIDRSIAASAELRQELPSDHSTRLAHRKAAAEHDMSIHDRLPAYAREVLHGLPNSVDINAALAAGCRTQADAEEWVRRNYGPSAVERFA